MNNLSKNSLQNIDSYQKVFQDNYHTVVFKYIQLINEYLKHCLDNVYIQNPNYKKSTINKGISTIKHIFNILFLYTKNLNMTFYNCQKSYVYYIEFISQIGDDTNSYLQLNSKDASLFAFKKTIFDVNNEIRKEYEVESKHKQYLKIINSFIDCYNLIVLKLLDYNDLNKVIDIINTDLIKIFQKLSKLYNDCSEYNKLLLFNKYAQIINCDKIFIENLEIFIKKLKKKVILKDANIDIEILYLL